MLLQDILPLSQRYLELSLGKIQQFVLLASKLKDDILLAQLSSILASVAAALAWNQLRVGAELS